MPIQTDRNPGVTLPVSMVECTHKGQVPSPWPEPAGRTYDVDEWEVTFARDDNPANKLTVPFYVGLGHNGKPPTAEEIMECLCSDAAGVTADEPGDIDFEHFAAEYDYNKDSRRSFGLYEACVESAEALRGLLGEHFHPALWGDE